MKRTLPLFILILVAGISAQVRKPLVKPSPNKTPVVETKAPTQKVILEKTNGDKITGLFIGGDTDSISIDLDGNRIIIKLSDVAIMRFGETPVSANTETKADSSVLNVEAAVIYRSGQVVPVARTTFFLLDDDVTVILKNAGVQPTAMTSRSYSDYSKAILTDIGFSARYGSLPDYQRFSAAMAEAIKPHIKYTFQTDFSGKASLSDVPQGKFYLFGLGSTRNSGVVWNLAIDTAAGNSLTLDANNAAFAY